jgi:hypothetical protein
MDNIFAVALLIVVALACLLAFFSVLGVFFPRRIAQTQSIARQSPERALLVGLVNVIFFLALILGIGRIGAGLSFSEAIILLILVILAVGLSFGLAGVVQLVGERLFPDSRPLVRTGWGTISVGLACAVPYVGWYGLFVFVSLLGLGSFILSFFRKNEPEPKINPTPANG